MLSCLFHRQPGLANKEIRRQWRGEQAVARCNHSPQGVLPAEHFKSSLGFSAEEGGIFRIRALSLVASCWCLSRKTIAELLTLCHPPPSNPNKVCLPPTPSPGTEAVKRCSTNPEYMIIINSLPSPKYFNSILVTYSRCLWVRAAASALFLMVMYAEITLESIISLLWAVAVHNSWWDLGRDTDAAVQTVDTVPCFNSQCSSSCVSYSTDAANGILWSYLSLNFSLISRFLSCMCFSFCEDVAICLIKSRVLLTCHTKQQHCVTRHGAQPLTWSLIGFQACLGDWFSVTEPQT